MFISIGIVGDAGVLEGVICQWKAACLVCVVLQASEHTPEIRRPAVGIWKGNRRHPAMDGALPAQTASPVSPTEAVL
jgi:hypothetical protein